MKFWALALLLANLLLAGLIYTAEMQEIPVVQSTDFNVEKMRLVSLSSGVATTQSSLQQTTDRPLACLQWSGIAGADFAQAKERLAEIVSLDSVTERRVEEPTRFGVAIPATANPSPVVARLRQAGVADVSLRSDNTVSLGLFSTEGAAKRYLAELHDKGFTNARIEPRGVQIKEGVFIVKETGNETLGKMDALKALFTGSSVQPVECPGPARDR